MNENINKNVNIKMSINKIKNAYTNTNKFTINNIHEV